MKTTLPEKIGNATQQLNDCALSGNTEGARRALDDGALIDNGEPWRKVPTILSKAISAGSIDICRLLKSKGVEIDFAVFLTAEIAKKNRNMDTVRFLLNECVPWDKPSKSCFAGSWGSHFAMMGPLVFEEAYAAAPNKDAFLFQPDEKWVTPLERAALLSDEGICQYLLEKGAKPDTDVLIASREMGPEMIRLFIAAGARLDVPGRDGLTALEQACSDGHVEFARVLLDAGAGIEARSNGRTPLMLAVEYPEILELLLERGADILAVGDDGKNLLHHSVEHGLDLFLNIAGLMKDHPETFIQTDDKNQNILHTIAQSEESQFNTREFIDAFPSGVVSQLINAQDVDGNSPLHLALVQTNVNLPLMIGALIDAGADMDSKNRQGDTAFLFAARNSFECDFKPADFDSTASFKILLSKSSGNTQINATNANADTVLDLALRALPNNQVEDMFPLLVAEGAQTNRLNLSHLPGNIKWPTVLKDCRLLAAAKTGDIDYFKDHVSKYPDQSADDLKKTKTFVHRKESGDKTNDICSFFNSWMAQRAIEELLSPYGQKKSTGPGK